MGPNALAIVFAPCILRTSKIQVAQDSLHDIARQTACVEAILHERMRTVSHLLYTISSPKLTLQWVTVTGVTPKQVSSNTVKS